MPEMETVRTGRGLGPWRTVGGLVGLVAILALMAVTNTSRNSSGSRPIWATEPLRVTSSMTSSPVGMTRMRICLKTSIS